MKKGDIIKFGKYPQDEDGRVLPIEWIVLDVTGNEAFLISRYALDCREYNLSGGDITWEYCDLRKWLNTDFIKNAFSDEEAKNIKVSQLRNNDNPLPINFESMFPRAHGGNDTFDQVFCLSIDEVEKYLSNINNGIVCRPSAYIINRVLSNYFSGCCAWWLRSPGYHQDSAIIISRDNIPDLGGGATFDKRIAVRPALRLALSSEEEKEQKLVDVVRKTHNLQCGIFGNISDDLGDLQIPELSPKVRMAYAYARRFAAAGLYVQGVFSYDQYMYICTVFMSFQITTAKDANLLPGEDVSFQEDALYQAAELLITYDRRFNISFIKFFGTILNTQGKSFPVLPSGSSYEKTMDVIEKQIALFFTPSPTENNQTTPQSASEHENSKNLDNSNPNIIFLVVIVVILIAIFCVSENKRKAAVEENNILVSQNLNKEKEIERINLLYDDAQKEIIKLKDYISELENDNEKQKNQISELIKQKEKTKKADNTSYWSISPIYQGYITYSLHKKNNDYSIYLECGGDRVRDDNGMWGPPMNVNVDLPNKKTIDSSKEDLTFVIDGQIYHVPQDTRSRGTAQIWGEFVNALFNGNHIEVLRNGEKITSFSPTKESKKKVKEHSDCYQQW